MKQLLSNVWRWDAKGFVRVLCLNAAASLMSSISIVMLIPMLDLLNISVGDDGLSNLLKPFAQLGYMYRAMVIIGIFVVLMLARAVLTRYASVQQNSFFSRYELDLRAHLYDKISGADWEILARKKHTELTNLMINQTYRVGMCLQRIVNLVTSCVTALMQLAIALWMSLPLTVMVLVVGTAFLWLFRPFQKKSRQYGEKSVKITREMYREIQNQLGGIKEIRAYGVEEEQAKVFGEVSRESYRTNLKLLHLQVRPQLCYSLAAAIMVAIAFFFSIAILDTGTAQLVVMVYIFSRLWPIFASWQGQLQNIHATLPAYETIQQAIADLEQESCPTAGGETELPFQTQIQFQNVSFIYKDGSENVLQDVSFTLPYGSVTALVGRSGAGKSTAADLLLGLLRPTAGQILVDGKPLSPQNLAQWHKSIGYVPQEPLILDASIRENLLRFHPDATEADMIQALKDAQAWSFVEKLEQGLDTVLGTKGLGLSGGERQRIVLARVLMGNPRLIILDEATSALDYENENLIRETIRTLAGKTTILIIAHRLATIRGAQYAVVLENGAVVQQGDMQTLLTCGDGYLSQMVSVE